MRLNLRINPFLQPVEEGCLFFKMKTKRGLQHQNRENTKGAAKQTHILVQSEISLTPALRGKIAKALQRLEKQYNTY